jgi:hypothetical protein
MVADAIADLAEACGGEGASLGPRCFDVHLSDDLADLLRPTAAKRHHQIDAEPPQVSTGEPLTKPYPSPMPSFLSRRRRTTAVDRHLIGRPKSAHTDLASQGR